LCKKYSPRAGQNTLSGPNLARGPHFVHPWAKGIKDFETTYKEIGLQSNPEKGGKCSENLPQLYVG